MTATVSDGSHPEEVRAVQVGQRRAARCAQGDGEACRGEPPARRVDARCDRHPTPAPAVGGRVVPGEAGRPVERAVPDGDRGERVDLRQRDVEAVARSPERDPTRRLRAVLADRDAAGARRRRRDGSEGARAGGGGRPARVGVRSTGTAARRGQARRGSAPPTPPHGGGAVDPEAIVSGSVAVAVSVGKFESLAVNVEAHRPAGGRRRPVEGPGGAQREAGRHRPAGQLPGVRREPPGGGQRRGVVLAFHGSGQARRRDAHGRQRRWGGRSSEGPDRVVDRVATERRQRRRDRQVRRVDLEDAVVVGQAVEGDVQRRPVRAHRQVVATVTTGQGQVRLGTAREVHAGDEAVPPADTADVELGAGRVDRQVGGLGEPRCRCA